MDSQIVARRKPQNQNISYPAEELLGYLGRTAGQVATGVAGSPSNIAQGATNLGTAAYNYATGSEHQAPKLPLPTTENIRETLKPHIPEEALTPKGWLQEGIDLTAQTAPLLWFGGGSLPSKIGADLSASLAAKGVEKAGAGPGIQFAAGILGSKGFTKGKNLISKTKDPEKLMSLAKHAEGEYWKETEQLGKPINKKVPKYRQDLEKIRNKIESTSELKGPEKKELLEKWDLLQSDIKSDTINAGQLTDRVTEINKSLKQSGSREYKSFLSRAQKAMFEAGEDIGKDHPKWHKDWTTARDITKAVHYQSSLGDLLDEYPKLSKVITSPIVKKILGIGGGYGVGGIAGAAAGALGTSTYKKAEQLYGFWHNKQARFLLQKAAEQTANRNVPELFKTYTKLNRLGEKMEKEGNEIVSRRSLEPSESGSEIVRRRKS